ncbi:hypothetical protein DFQ27_000557 [Actinomortierella ambigua]|uniref:DUF4211 domain-containing protein n=1 Tax=Actinomortierella ambigua TaxID=1343610 RepID=A0A9P6QCH4_9FUNG|nr:hypothetical protein DFQ27_000557 [Actinomortierella ambigua]
MRPRRAAAIVSRQKTTVALLDSDTEASEIHASPTPTPPSSKRRRQVSDSEDGSESEPRDREDDDNIGDSSTNTSIMVSPLRRKLRKARMILESDEDGSGEDAPEWSEPTDRRSQSEEPPPSEPYQGSRDIQSSRDSRSSLQAQIERGVLMESDSLSGEEEPLVLNRLSNRSPRKLVRSYGLSSDDDEGLDVKLKTHQAHDTPAAELTPVATTVAVVDESDEEDLGISPSRRRSLPRRALTLSPDGDLDSPPVDAVDQEARNRSGRRGAHQNQDHSVHHNIKEQLSPSRRRSLPRRQRILSSDTEDDTVQEEKDIQHDEELELHQDLEDLSQSWRRLSHLGNDALQYENDIPDLAEGHGSYNGHDEDGDENDEDGDEDEGVIGIDSEEDFDTSRHGVYANRDDAPENGQLTDVENEDDLDFIAEDESQDTQDMRRVSSELIPGKSISCALVGGTLSGETREQNIFPPATHFFPCLCPTLVMFKLSNRQKLSVDFKVYCQYLLNLLFDRNFDDQIKDDEYFQSSITHVVRTIETFQNSLSNSQISNRPATFKVVLSGTFEDWDEFQPEHIDGESEDEQLSGEEEAKVDTKCVYYLGSQNYHAFYHWKFHLLQRMTVKVNEYMPKPFSTMSQKDLDAVDTNEVMELLESSGYVSRLWHELKDLMTKARSISHAAD